MGEGEIDADKKRCLVRRVGKREKPVQHRFAPPVAVPVRIERQRGAPGRHRKLDPRLARAARAGPVDADEAAEHGLAVGGLWHACQKIGRRRAEPVGHGIARQSRFGLFRHDLAEFDPTGRSC